MVFSFDLLSLFQDLLIAPEVDIGGVVSEQCEQISGLA